MSVGDSLKEAIWAKILDDELPYGANQVLFILSTGTPAEPSNPDSEARTLMVRLDAKRPAYFQPNISVTDERLTDALKAHHTRGDQKRMETVLPKLLDVLPIPASLSGRSVSEVELLRASFLEFTDRVCYQYATQYTRQSLMSGISSSNIEMSGKALDFGTAHALIGFPRTRVDRDESPHGTTDTIKKDLILELAQDLRAQLPAELAAAIPQADELIERVDHQFARRGAQGFLELAGTPKEFSEELLKIESGQQLANLLERIARSGNSKLEEYRDGTVVARTGTYNLERILNRVVAMTSRQSLDFDDSELKAALPSLSLRKDLLSSYGSYVTDLTKIAENDSIAQSSLLNYMKIAVKVRNRPYYGLREKWSFWPKASKAIRRYFAGDEFAVQDFLDITYERNVREIPSQPFTIEISEPSKLKNGISRHVTFNLKTGATTISAQKLLSRRTFESRSEAARASRLSEPTESARLRCESSL